jgi:hypothetical protein
MSLLRQVDSQGSQPPPGGFHQPPELVEGPWSNSTRHGHWSEAQMSCPPGGLCGGASNRLHGSWTPGKSELRTFNSLLIASAFRREIWSKHPLFRAQSSDQLVEGLSKTSENWGLRPLRGLNLDPL